MRGLAQDCDCFIYDRCIHVPLLVCTCIVMTNPLPGTVCTMLSSWSQCSGSTGQPTVPISVTPCCSYLEDHGASSRYNAKFIFMVTVYRKYWSA